MTNLLQNRLGNKGQIALNPHSEPPETATSATPIPPPVKQNSAEIIQVSYGATANLGNYESSRIDLVAKVNPEQSWKSVLNELRQKVDEEIERELARSQPAVRSKTR